MKVLSLRGRVQRDNRQAQIIVLAAASQVDFLFDHALRTANIF